MQTMSTGAWIYRTRIVTHIAQRIDPWHSRKNTSRYYLQRGSTDLFSYIDVAGVGSY